MKARLFAKDQIKRLANIFDNAGQVLLATVVIPSMLSLLKTIETAIPAWLLWLGLFNTGLFWWIALRLERIST